MNGIFHLKGTVKNYDWGGFSFLPELLNVSNTAKTPFAEYWIGTHHAGQSFVMHDDREIALSELTGQLPWLLKLLDVREMLSIQVHPGKEAAEKEFELENRSGMAPGDPRRNYRDPNDKPELMVALEEFWLLHGFKNAEDLHDILVNVTELNELLPVFHNSGHAGLYETVMYMEQDEVNRLLRPIYEKLVVDFSAGRLEKNTEDYWALKAMKNFTRDDKIDRGVFSVYFFNLLCLKRGEGIFQDSGIPHAYLEGRNVEIMGNSDNVLRGGLTNKPIAIGELMKHTRFEGIQPRVILPAGQGNEKEMAAPTNLFRLSVLDLHTGGRVKWKAVNHEVLLLAAGEADVYNKENHLTIRKGQPALLITGGEEITLESPGDTLLFKATS